MTHVGQLAMLRRLAGSPVLPSENFIFAEIRTANVDAVQPPHAAAPDLWWKPRSSSTTAGVRQSLRRRAGWTTKCPPSNSSSSARSKPTRSTRSELLDAGLDVHAPVKGQIGRQFPHRDARARTPFPTACACCSARGAVLDDPRIAPVLLDDPEACANAILADRSLLDASHLDDFGVHSARRRVAAARGGGVGNLKAARALVEMGADVNTRAAFDAHGLNGHTPIFHTVNSNGNRSAPILDLLLDAGAAPTSHSRASPGAGIRVGDHVLRRDADLMRKWA